MSFKEIAVCSEFSIILENKYIHIPSNLVSFYDIDKSWTYEIKWNFTFETIL